MKSLLVKRLEAYVANAERWQKKYRECLMAIGKSPDYHIYDLSIEWLRALRGSSSRDFLIQLAYFYWSLESLDQTILVYEVLEKKRHYRFWFLGIDFAEGEYERRKYGVLHHFAERFHETCAC